MTTTRYFAAHDADTVYAVATHRNAALEAAVDDTGLDEASFDTAEISEALFNQIERQGWDGRRQSFEIRDGR